MSGPEDKKEQRRWQFSLASVMIALAITGAGAGLLKLTDNRPREPIGDFHLLFVFAGLFLIAAGLGFLIGFGFGRWRGALLVALLAGATALTFLCILHLLVLPTADA